MQLNQALLQRQSEFNLDFDCYRLCHLRQSMKAFHAYISSYKMGIIIVPISCDYCGD